MFWIIVILVILAYLFFSDKKYETNRVQQQGGFYLKYKELLDYFLTIPDIKVEKKEKTRMVLVARNYSAVTRYTIAHGFEDVSIFWTHNSLAYGEHYKSWTFPESMPQKQMLELIEIELDAYTRNVIGNGFN